MPITGQPCFPFGKGTTRIVLVALSLFIFLFSSPSHAQPKELKLTDLTTTEGLSSNFITSIVQDTCGFMWFGTENGLNKFDGYQITVYKFDRTDSTSLINNGIWDMLIDSRGKFWLATSTGLECFDHKHNVFIHYKSVTPDGNINPENVRKIFEDTKGNIWIGTHTGIALVDEEKLSYTVYPLAPAGKVRISTITEDPTGNFWVGSLSHGLFLFDISRKVFKPYPIKYIRSGIFRNQKDTVFELTQDNVITIAYKDRQGELWFGTNDGLNHYDRISGAFINYSREGSENERTVSDNDIRALSEDQTGNLWIGHLNGISILDKIRKRFIHHGYSIDNPSGLSNNFVTCIYKDRSGNMWLGTRNYGLNIYYSTGNNFKLYAHQPNNPKSLNNNIVKAIVKDKRGRLWLGTDGGGLNLLQEDGSFIAYRHNPKDPGSLPNNLILALYEDKQQNLWVSTFDGALSLMKAETGRFEHIFPAEDPSSLRSASVSVMYEDTKQNFWIGTWYSGLHLLDRKTKKFTRYPFNTSDQTGLSSEKVIDIHEDKKGDLLIATGNGLNIFDPATGKFTHYLHDDKIKTSMGNSGCNSICQDKSGQLWIGTNGGLNLFDPEKSTFQAFGSKDGLQTETVQGVLSDDEGNLWISSIKGIYKFNPKTKQERNYGVSDGLQGEEFITHSYFKSDDGELFFGGTNGANAISPKLIKVNTEAPPVVITDFKVFHKPLKAGGKDGLLEHTITFTDKITLSVEEYIFSIDFAALNYTNPKDNQYAYKLEGLDQDWNHIGNQHSITYTGLDPGEYTFKVKASNNDLVWNEEGASLEIVITPPFWATTWFRALAPAVALLAVFLIFYARIKIIENQKKVLEGLVVVRTKEVVFQKEEIAAQKEDIERQLEEITAQNDQIMHQNYALDEVRKDVKEKNDQLEEYNARLENMVRQRTKQLLQTNEELDQFVYRSAHDLKGPISRIMGLCYLGSLENRDKKVSELLKLMEGCSIEMSDKLARLMNIHTINKKEVNLEPVYYQEIIKDVIDKVASEQNTDGVKFYVHVEDGEYKSDKYLVSILLKNVIENAVRFKDLQKSESRIKIEVNQKKKGTRIVVSDNGLGIPKAQATRVFDMFVVCHESIRGFGLGLYEAKLIARKLKGRIKLRYPESKDTEFRITLHRDDDMV